MDVLATIGADGPVLLTVLALAAAAFAGSALSATIGVGGGILLLAVMLLFLDPVVAIPLHGVVQIASNGTRSIVQRRHVDWRTAAWYALPLLPLALAGAWVALRVPPNLGKALIGAFVLVATLRPAWLRIRPPTAAGALRRRFLLLGGGVGFLGSIIGATGPLIAPFFLDLGLSRQAIVGTKAACQTAGHLAKILAFGWVGVSYVEQAGLLAAMIAMVVIGTAVGSRLLERVSETLFGRLYRIVVVLASLRLLADAVLG